MSIYARSSTLAHSGGNALDRTVTHVASYLPARLTQLMMRTDVAGPCANHSNQVTAYSSAELENRFCSVFFEFPLIALKECYHVFRYLQSILVSGR